MAKQKETKTNRPARKKTWVKFRHRVLFAFLRPIFRIFLRLKYGYRAVPARLKRAPCLIMCNHQAVLDMFMVSISFKFPIYFIASEDLFTLGWKTRALRYLAAPIPKSKNVSDLGTILDSRRVVSEGGAVGVFIEGNRTFSGGQGYIGSATAKLAKLLKVPLILYTFRGGYGVDPRFAAKSRKGRSKGEIQRILSPEEIAAMPLDELLALIRDTLRVDEIDPEVPIRSKRRAEYLERVLYYCPVCGAYETLESRGNELRCNNCGLTVRYESDLTFSSVQGTTPCRTVEEWRDAEVAALRAREIKGLSGVIFSDDGVTLTRAEGIRRVAITKGKLTLSADAFRIGDVVFPISEITAVTAQGKHKILVYHGGFTYQLTGQPRFSPVKYTHAYYLLSQTELDAENYLGGV